MPSYLVSFGHGYSKSGAYDTGCVSGDFTEQEMVRKLKPYIKNGLMLLVQMFNSMITICMQIEALEVIKDISLSRFT